MFFPCTQVLKVCTTTLTSVILFWFASNKEDIAISVRRKKKWVTLPNSNPGKTPSDPIGYLFFGALNKF